MILSKRVALDGVYLDEMHERIVIRSINTGVPHENITAVNRMGGAGQRITGEHWETLDVIVTVAIDVPKKELAYRRAIFDMINGWAARKGWLTVNWMQNRRMYVDKVIFPSSGDLWEWTNDYQITFRAYNVPFWQDALPAQASTGVVSQGNLSLQIGGLVTTVLDATFENRSGMTINNFLIRAQGSEIRLSSLGLGGNQKLSISHGTDGLLRIRIGSTSVYNKYTGDDDLYVDPSVVPVHFEADRAGVLTVMCWGRYL